MSFLKELGQNIDTLKRVSRLKFELETPGAAALKLPWRLFEFIRTFSEDITFSNAVALEF